MTIKNNTPQITIKQHPKSKKDMYFGQIGRFFRWAKLTDFASKEAFETWIIEQNLMAPKSKEKTKRTKKDVMPKKKSNPNQQTDFEGVGDYIGQIFHFQKELHGYNIYSWHSYSSNVMQYDLFPMKMRSYPEPEDFPSIAKTFPSLQSAESYVLTFRKK